MILLEPRFIEEIHQHVNFDIWVEIIHFLKYKAASSKVLGLLCCDVGLQISEKRLKFANGLKVSYDVRSQHYFCDQLVLQGFIKQE